MLKNKGENSIELIALRPKIDIEFSGEKSELESFMHVTLRPILKMQHFKLVSLIEHSIGYKQDMFNASDETKNFNALKAFLSKNSALKNQLLGVIIGLFTDDEFLHYFENVKDINRRITEMVIVRYLSKIN